MVLALLERSSASSKMMGSIPGEKCLDDFDTPLIGNFLIFASRGDRVGLNQMLREEISPNVQDYDKRTSLHLAASEGHNPIVELLLHYKANVNLKDQWQRTLVTDGSGSKYQALTDARLYGHLGICRIVEVNGGIDLVSDYPMTVRHEGNSNEVNIDMSELNLQHSCAVEQGNLDDILHSKVRLDLLTVLCYALDIARNLLQDGAGHLKIGEYWVQMFYVQILPNQDSSKSTQEFTSGLKTSPHGETHEDVRSFGMILFQTLEGRDKWINDSTLDFEPRFQLSKGPKRIKQLIEQCTSKDPYTGPSFCRHH